MKKFNNQSYGSHVGRMNYGGAKFCRFALFPLMLLMLLFVPTRMVAQTEVEYDNTITFTALEGYPQGMSEAENFKKLFDGKKTEGNSSKWCCYFYGSAYVIFEASKAGVPVGYTITTGNDNEEYNCRNPLSWKLYGNNTGKDDAWTLIDEVSDDKVLKDENNTSYDFKCECSTSYKYFKWEISAIHSGGTMQVGEFELKLNTCSHKNADGSDALGEVINTVGPTCTEYGYTTHKCSLCNSIVKVYKDDELKPHTLTHHALKDATCTEAGNIEYWQCSVCNKLFSDEAATKEITDAASLEIPAKGHTFDNKGTCTVCQYKDPRYDLFNNLDGITGVTITDNGSYPWQMLDLKAEGMENLGFTFPEGSNVLMSSNYLEKGSSSETVIRLNVSKPILLTSQVLVSSELNCDIATITLDNKESWNISGIKQKEIKALLSVGEHILKLSYYKDNSTNEGADRAFIYDLKTATTISDYVYVAESDATNSTLTFKKITSDNWGSLDLSRMTIVNNERTVKEMCTNNYSSIKNIIFDESFKTYAPTSLKDFFIDCTNLETISGLEYLNTANVTDMNHMFYGCSALKSLDLTHFNTAKVTDMNSMFDRSSALTSLDLTNFNTANVSDMGYMFMGCSALTTIFVSDKFVTTNVEYGYDMFKGCTNLKDYSDSMTDHTYANCGPDGYFTSGCWYAEFDNSTGTLTFKCGLSKPAGAYGLNEGRNLPDWNNLGTNVKKVVFDASFASARPTNCYGWFKDFTNLTTIEGFEYLNTENVTNMTGVFNGCSALTSLDLTNFNTAKVTDMKLLFANCSALESLDLSMFNTENVTSMPSMFNGATNLKTLNVSNFNTEKVNNMGHMFANCPNLTSLDLSSFNTKRVEYVDNIFKNCSNLTTIYASENFAFGSGLKNGADMFLGCDKLKGFIEYNKNTDTDKNNSKFANYKTGYFTNLVGKNGDEKIGAVGEILTAESLALDDDKDFVAYESFAVEAASYRRDMNAKTTWATLCLPFEVSLANQNFRAFKLLSADDVAETVELEEIETSIAAGTPVIIKMKDGAKSLSISEADKAIAKDVLASETANGNYQLQGIYTQKEFSKDADNHCYIVKGDKLMNPAKLLEATATEFVGSKPFRAYMVDNSSAPAAGARMFSISIGGSTTAIKQLESTADSKAEYYDLQGRRLQNLQKGVNIVKRGGKTMKVIIK
jgi:surface protein